MPPHRPHQRIPSATHNRGAAPPNIRAGAPLRPQLRSHPTIPSSAIGDASPSPLSCPTSKSGRGRWQLLDPSGFCCSSPSSSSVT